MLNATGQGAMVEAAAPGRRSTARAEWAESWPVVLSAAIGCSVGGLHLHSMGLFIQPLEAEFGWSRSQISMSLSLSSLIGVTMALFVGMAVDHWGSRWIALAGLMVYCLAFAGLGAVGPSVHSYWAMFAMLSVGLALITPTVWTAVINRRFAAARGLAFAVTLSGPSLCSFLIPLIAQRLIADHGWRIAYVSLSALFAAIAIPLTLLLFHDRRAASAMTHSRTALSGMGSLLLVPGFRSGRYWRITLAGFFTTSTIIGLSVHFIPISAQAGLDRSSAALIAGSIGIASLAGRLIEGIVIDRWKATTVGAVAFGLPTIAALLILLYDGSFLMGLAAGAAMGLGLGAEYSVLAYLISRCFGREHFGVLFGVTAAGVHLGAGFGPLLAAAAFDHFESYAPFLIASIIMSAICSLVVLTLGPLPAAGALSRES